MAKDTVENQTREALGTVPRADETNIPVEKTDPSFIENLIGPRGRMIKSQVSDFFNPEEEPTKEIDPLTFDKVTDFFIRERGLERSEKLEGAIRYYLGPYAGSLGQANQLINPIVGLQDAGEATREGRYMDAVTDTVAAGIPLAAAKLAKPLVKGVQSGIDEAVDAITEVMTGSSAGAVDQSRRMFMKKAPLAVIGAGVAASSASLLDDVVTPLAKKTAGGGGALGESLAKLKSLSTAREIEFPKGQEIYKKVRDGIYQGYFEASNKYPELAKHDEKIKKFYKLEDEEYVKNLFPLVTKQNLTKVSNKELDELSNKIQFGFNDSKEEKYEALYEKLILIKKEYIKRDYNPTFKSPETGTAIEELDQAIFFAKYPEAEGIEDYENFITSGTIPSFPDVLSKMTPANSASEPKIISFSKKQDDKNLQEFSKKLSSTVAERVSKMGELVGELKEAGIYGDYNVGAVVQGKNIKGDPKPFTVEGQSLQKVKLNNPTLKRTEERLGMKFNYIEKDGDYYIAMLNIAQKDADGITRTQAYLDAVKHKGYPVLSGPTGSVPKEFNKGGTAMNNQTQMAFALGGEAETRDPVSGNNVPPGSLPVEVRDDIPARLSEGEYVVPADVVRFFGVKFFEDIRMEAKKGLQQMDVDGRIGGEPIPPQMQMAQAPEQDIDAMIDAEMGNMNAGGLMSGYAEGAAVTAPSYTPGGGFGYGYGSQPMSAPQTMAPPAPVAPVITATAAPVARQEPVGGCPEGTLWNGYLCAVNLSYNPNAGDLPDDPETTPVEKWYDEDGGKALINPEEYITENFNKGSAGSDINPLVPKGAVAQLAFGVFSLVNRKSSISKAAAAYRLAEAMGQVESGSALEKIGDQLFGRGDHLGRALVGQLSDGDWKLAAFAKELGFKDFAAAAVDAILLKNKAGDYAGSKAGTGNNIYTGNPLMSGGRTSEDDAPRDKDGKLLKILPYSTTVIPGSERPFINEKGETVKNPKYKVYIPYTAMTAKQKRDRRSDAGLSRVAAADQKIRDRLGRDPTEADVDVARKAGTNLLGEPLPTVTTRAQNLKDVSNDDDNETYSTDTATAIKQMRERGTFNQGGRNKGGLVSKPKKKKAKAYKRGGLASKKK